MNSSEHDIEQLIDPPSFFEELHLFMKLLNDKFPKDNSNGRRHNITLTPDGHLEVTIWHTDKTGNIGSFYCRLEDENDHFQSMDDVIVDLCKYIEQNAK